MKAAVVGAGWAGLAAALALQDAAWDVSVFEAGHIPGGRARRVPREGDGTPLDNGQHILLGAYAQTLALMRRLGRDPDALFVRQPLRLQSLDGSFRLAAPRLPAPWHTLAALLGARGLSWRGRRDALRMMAAMRSSRWLVPERSTVAALASRYGQSQETIALLWEPLCLAALNTPPARACAQLFANVLRDSLDGARRDSDLLLPRVDLSALWPDAAAARCKVRFGAAVRRVDPENSGVNVDGERYDAAIVALPPAAAARVLQGGAAHTLAAGLGGMPHAPIATLTAVLATSWTLPFPMMMLREDPSRAWHGQWLFDRARLAGKPGGGEIAIVASAADALAALAGKDRQAATRSLLEQVRAQARAGGLRALPPIVRTTLLIDKRATFLAIPGLRRPTQRTSWPRLALAGDWTDTGYPGVLEGAIRSGRLAAEAVIAGCGR